MLSLIQFLMQLSSGIFMLFYHYALGKKSAKIADNLSLYFILGVEFFTAAVWFTVFLILPDASPILFWILAGILFAESLASLFFYYRKSSATALFIPRSIAQDFEIHAQNIKTHSDAFILGFLANIPELIFTLPLYCIAVVILSSTNFLPHAAFIILYVISAITPLFIIHALYHTGHNFADIERLRVRFKPLIRFLIFASFLITATLVINFGVINNG